MNSRRLGRLIRTLLPTLAALSSPLFTLRHRVTWDSPLKRSAVG
jgi:hypothetical protein